MLADVAVADGAEQRVGQGMQGDIGVGVPLEAMRVRDPHAAQPDVIAGNEAVHVEALAGADIGQAPPWTRHARPAAMSSAVVSLRLASLPSTSTTGSLRPLGHRRVVGHIMPARGLGGPVGGEDVAEPEALRRLGPPQAGTIDRRGDAVAGAGQLERIGQGQRRQSPRARRRAPPGRL